MPYSALQLKRTLKLNLFHVLFVKYVAVFFAEQIALMVFFRFYIKSTEGSSYHKLLHCLPVTTTCYRTIRYKTEHNFLLNDVR